jgi:hypothetical protein
VIVSDFKTKMKQARLPERSVPVCLRGDLVADHEALDRKLKQLQDRPADGMEDTGTGALVEQLEALQAEMADATEQFRLRALPGPKYRALKSAHPPRREGDEPDQIDANLGFNREMFLPELIRLSVVEPTLDHEDWRELLGDSDEERARLVAEGKADEVVDGLLTDRQFGDLADAAYFLNRGEIGVPFSFAASRAKRTSADE